MAARQHPSKKPAAEVFLTRAVSLGWSAAETLENAKKAGHATLAGLSRRTISDRMAPIRAAALRRNRGKLDKLLEKALEVLGQVMEYGVTDVATDDGEELGAIPFDELNRGQARVLKSVSFKKRPAGFDAKGNPLFAVDRRIEVADATTAAKAVVAYHAQMLAAKDNAPPEPDPAETLALLEKGIAAMAASVPPDSGVEADQEPEPA